MFLLMKKKWAREEEWRSKVSSLKMRKSRNVTLDSSYKWLLKYESGKTEIEIQRKTKCKNLKYMENDQEVGT
jgi:hypothetical protein